VYEADSVARDRPNSFVQRRIGGHEHVQILSRTSGSNPLVHVADDRITRPDGQSAEIDDDVSDRIERVVVDDVYGVSTADHGVVRSKDVDSRSGYLYPVSSKALEIGGSTIDQLASGVRPFFAEQKYLQRTAHRNEPVADRQGSGIKSGAGYKCDSSVFSTEVLRHKCQSVGAAMLNAALPSKTRHHFASPMIWRRSAVRLSRNPPRRSVSP
jgi:hypothetical protein